MHLAEEESPSHSINITHVHDIVKDICHRPIVKEDQIQKLKPTSHFTIEISLLSIDCKSKTILR